MLNMFPSLSFCSSGTERSHLSPQNPSAQGVSLSAQGKGTAPASPGKYSAINESKQPLGSLFVLSQLLKEDIGIIDRRKCDAEFLKLSGLKMTKSIGMKKIITSQNCYVLH